MAGLLSSVKKALQVLQAFSEDQTEWGVTELSLSLKSHKSSISRILITLQAQGFVEKNPQTGKYCLGFKVIELGQRALSRFELKEWAGPYLEELAGKTKEIIHLSLLDQNEIVYLDKKGKEQALTVATRIGGRNPAYCSAMGKVLLAALPPAELDRVLSLGPLQCLTPSTITEIPSLKKELERVRKRGYAIDHEESFPGIRCVAAPIRNRRKEVIAAVSATVPKQRMGREKMAQIVQLVTRCAKEISENMPHGMEP